MMKKAVLWTCVAVVLAIEIAVVVTFQAAIYTVAALTAASGVIVILRMYETHPPELRR